MNDKLTLEELATYLPWDIKCIIGDSNKVENIEFLGNNSVCVGKNTKGVLSWYKLSSIKPILRNLSDLTKEIEVHGEKFVPLLKIADFLGIKYLSYEILTNSIDFLLNPSYSRENTKTKELRKVRFWLNTFKTKSFNCTNADLMRGYDQYGAFQKLLSWHFDIFNLHERGLAIDINTLK